MDDKNKILKKKKFPAKISKGQNFEKHLKKKDANYCYFSNKIKVEMVKKVKSCSKSLIKWKLRIYSGKSASLD